MKKTNTRFAPSPTGMLHLGGARTALFNWLYAKKYNGNFYIRIEDSDVKRSRNIFTKKIIKDLQWLNLINDNKYTLQSIQQNKYQEIITYLLNMNKAYKCYCSKERLKILREQQIKNNLKPKYDNRCRKIKQNINKNTKFVIRFKTPIIGYTSWIDSNNKNISFNNNELDDFIIQREDGTFTYNLCVVVDDINMKITDIIRGDDHINNTPKQINLFKSLNAEIPKFYHIPMIVDESGKKLSKRYNDFNIEWYKNMGYLSQAIKNYIIRLGWSYKNKEFFNTTEMINLFDINNISKSPSKININKLNWINRSYLVNNTIDKNIQYEIFSYYQEKKLSINNKEKICNIVKLYSKKYSTLLDIINNTSFLIQKSHDFKINNALQKEFSTNNYVSIIKLLMHEILNSDEKYWNEKKYIYQLLLEISKKIQKNIKDIILIIRVLITGLTETPNISEIMYILGKKNILNRIENFLNTIK